MESLTYLKCLPESQQLPQELGSYRLSSSPFPLLTLTVLEQIRRC